MSHPYVPGSYARPLYHFRPTPHNVTINNSIFLNTGYSSGLGVCDTFWGGFGLGLGQGCNSLVWMGLNWLFGGFNNMFGGGFGNMFGGGWGNMFGSPMSSSFTSWGIGNAGGGCSCHAGSGTTGAGAAGSGATGTACEDKDVSTIQGYENRMKSLRKSPTQGLIQALYKDVKNTYDNLKDDVHTIDNKHRLDLVMDELRDIVANHNKVNPTDPWTVEAKVEPENPDNGTPRDVSGNNNGNHVDGNGSPRADETDPALIADELAQYGLLDCDITQDTIDNAKEYMKTLHDGDLKTAFQDAIEKAETRLANNNNAVMYISSLGDYADGTVDYEDISGILRAARELVNILCDPSTKQQLTDAIKAADAKRAQETGNPGNDNNQGAEVTLPTDAAGILAMSDEDISKLDSNGLNNLLSILGVEFSSECKDTVTLPDANNMTVNGLKALKNITKARGLKVLCGYNQYPNDHFIVGDIDDITADANGKISYTIQANKEKCNQEYGLKYIVKQGEGNKWTVDWLTGTDASGRNLYHRACTYEMPNSGHILNYADKEWQCVIMTDDGYGKLSAADKKKYEKVQ